ncbi:MAG: tetratricopeptide repeat protein [Limnohabitans sp.]|jgi:predicted TPR repeat methyltransferase
MTDPLARARTHFHEGLGHAEREEWQAARAAFEAALQWAPERPSVLLNLGIAEIRLGQAAAALPRLQAASMADPDMPDVWLALAWAHYAMGQWQQALDSGEKAQCLKDMPLAAQLRHAQCLSRLGRVDEALAAFARVQEQAPQLHEPWTEQGDLYRSKGERTRARSCYEQALALGGDPALHRYYLSALAGDAQSAPLAPLHYVRSLFDQYADDFEQHLVQQLGYQGHRVLVQQVLAIAPGRFVHTLDMGCGTGLCGQLLRPHTDRLTGIDLSPAMVAKATESGIYDELQVVDATTYLSAITSTFDLIVAADVFIYIGALETVFAALRPRLMHGGRLAFTLEEPPPGRDMVLTPELRYAHSEAYMVHLARQHGLRLTASQRSPLRFDQRQPVWGRYMVLQAPGAA